MPIISNTEITGTIREFAGGASSLKGYLVCDGTVLERTEYPSLFAVIGTVYNTVGETSNQFRLPDLRGKATIGAGCDTYRNLTNRVLGEYGGEEAHVLSTDEISSHGHSAGTMDTETQSHSHTATTNNVDLNHTHTYARNDSAGNVDGPSNQSSYKQQITREFDTGPSITMSHSHTSTMNNSVGNHTHALTTNTGDSVLNLKHENMQPFLVLDYYIKY